MNRQVRLKVEMGAHALEFSQAQPDTEPAMQGAVSKLEQLLRQANAAAVSQRDGLIQVHAASALKEELRRKMGLGIGHMAEVGRAAARERQELATTFRFKPDATSFRTFLTACRAMVEAAEAHKDTLVKFGQVQSVVDEFKQQLDQFDAAITQGNEGRAAHVGATLELQSVAQEIARTVRVMDARNRQRFAGDPQLLGAWLYASTVHGKSRAGSDSSPAPSDGAAPAGSESRPAA
jgi:hypothetical protein